MTRSDPGELFAYNPEIDRTYHRLNKVNRRVTNHSFAPNNQVDSDLGELSDSASDSSSNFASYIGDSVSEFSADNMANPNNRTLKQLAAPDVAYQPLCIQYPDLDAPFELKSGLIHLLPKFHGLAGEDPHKHLKEFHVVCSTMRPQGVPEDHVKLKAFPFSLDAAAKDWLYYLHPGSITSWDGMKRSFLEKFFPASRTASIRKEICGIRQFSRETLYEYWERFKKLCATCPHHQISEQLLIQYFYEGLTPMDRSMVDAASGGALMDKTPVEARSLIANMAENSQQFGSRALTPAKGVHEVNVTTDNQRLENKITELTSLVRQLAIGQHQQVNAANQCLPKACGICTSADHPTDMCPTLQETDQGVHESAAVAGMFTGGQPYRSQQNYDPFSDRYNPGWKDHPNLKYGPGQQNVQQQQRFQAAGSSNKYQPPPFRQQQNMQQPMQNTSVGPSLEDLMKQMATSNIQFQQNINTTIQDLQTQIGQLATTVNKLQSEGSGQIPSQPVINPKGNVSAITLRSGKELELQESESSSRSKEGKSNAAGNIVAGKQVEEKHVVGEM